MSMRAFLYVTRWCMRIGLFIYVLLHCTHQDVFTRTRAGDMNMVTVGTYHGNTIFLKDEGEYATDIVTLRNQIEEHGDVLPMIIHNFFSAPRYLTFEYKFALYDLKKDYLILRYFTRVHGHPTFAGYQVQIVGTRHSHEVVELYVSEVPFE
jgi:hypothetical protein